MVGQQIRGEKYRTRMERGPLAVYPILKGRNYSPFLSWLMVYFVAAYPQP